MRRHAGGAGCGACGWSSQDRPRGARVTVRPYYEGLPFSGLVRCRRKAGESRLILMGGGSTPSGTESYGPGAEEAAAVERREASILRPKDATPQRREGNE